MDCLHLSRLAESKPCLFILFKKIQVSQNILSYLSNNLNKEAKTLMETPGQNQKIINYLNWQLG